MSGGKQKYEDRKALKEAQRRPETLDFHYLRSNYFRVVHADGVYGGVSPKNHINMTFFYERHPTPKKVSHKVIHTDAVTVGAGPEIRNDAADGVERELEVELVINLRFAKSLVVWLQEKVEQLEDVLAIQSGKTGETSPSPSKGSSQHASE